ncbi:septal ring lytic transglycosylase RlpA family protein [Synechococcus sp. BSF8S]|uniref:septal ring lytic transglycosylase RlpA family protein n=1 Tax=Synechococcales TaxID=1890424 RepID=UPI0016261426|nr:MULTISPECIES: septal ring lytic transglycosylase RlpA family protein [unclassified Synechococcus]MBC1259738.1 septal ring lytic transglycosylase RlpA family protein [Synechococcus sp. BSF8S]MBC1262839.1 septal ring lytic transglycosylase RlpA family protein [Synechococcus sp. BSA11S]
MRRTFPLGALALLLSGSGVAVPVLAESARTESDSRVAMARPADTAPAAEPSKQGQPTEPVAIRQQESEAPAAEAQPEPTAPAPTPRRFKLAGTGEASWYGPGFFGNRTANGEVFRPGTMTAAHRTLPFGTKVKVTNLWNGRSAIVRINDRGPFHGNRIIDLAHGAAQRLGLVSSGIAQVRLEVVQ